MTNLFKISTTDLTPWEKTDQHAVNREDLYTSWIDGNWKEHREIVRTKISGTVVLGFKREADYSAFITLLSTAQNANGYYPITVWCSNTNTSESINAFLDISGDTVFDVTAPIKYHQITVTITGV